MLMVPSVSNVEMMVGEFIARDCDEYLRMMVARKLQNL
jgi:hypothetical protein